MFSDLYKLKILNLSMNNIETIIKIVLPRSVRIIDLSWNKLENNQRNIFSTHVPFEVIYSKQEDRRP